MKKDTSWKWALFALACVLVVWGCTWFFLVRHYPSEKMTDAIAARGQFGDMFGAANALFTGFALVGLAYTVFLELKQIEEQRNDARSAERDRQAQLTALQDQLKSLQSQTPPKFEWKRFERTEPADRQGNPERVTYFFVNKGGQFAISGNSDSSGNLSTSYCPGAIDYEEEGWIQFSKHPSVDYPIKFNFRYEYEGRSLVKKFVIPSGELPIRDNKPTR